MKMKFNDCWIPDEWKNKVSVEDDLLPVSHFDEIASYVAGGEFAWNFQHNISTGEDVFPDTKDNYNFGYSSVITVNVMKNKQGDQILQPGPSLVATLLSKDFIAFITPLLWYIKDHIGLDFLVKSRFDMTTRAPNKEYLHNIHVDYDGQYPHIGCIIYMKDSDGDTIFFNETTKDYSFQEIEKLKMDDLTVRERIHPKRGRVVLFDGSIIHSGFAPHNSRNRILLSSQFTNIPERKEDK